MKFQSLETRVALVTVMTSLLLMVTPSSADGFSCHSWSVDFDVAHGSGCRKISEDASNVPSDLRSLSLEGGEPGDAARLDDWDFEGLTRLESLSLSRMVIFEIEPCALCSLSVLRSVALDNVTVERLPPELLANSSELREFSATGCGLTDVPEELFAGNAYLRMVNLSDNELTYLPSGIFATNGNLQKVSLAGNRLTELPLWSFDRNPQLAVLWMDGDALTSLVEDFLGIGQPYPTLSLERNPLT